MSYARPFQLDWVEWLNSYAFSKCGQYVFLGMDPRAHRTASVKYKTSIITHQSWKCSDFKIFKNWHIFWRHNSQLSQTTQRAFPPILQKKHLSSFWMTDIDQVIFATQRSGISLSGICHRIRVGRMDGRKRFWSQLNNSKTVRGRPYVSIGNLYEPMGRLRMGLSPTPHVLPNLPNQRVEKVAK